VKFGQSSRNFISQWARLVKGAPMLIGRFVQNNRPKCTAWIEKKLMLFRQASNLGIPWPLPAL
jgi:hypothetical protein